MFTNKKVRFLSAKDNKTGIIFQEKNSKGYCTNPCPYVRMCSLLCPQDCSLYQLFFFSNAIQSCNSVQLSLQSDSYLESFMQNRKKMNKERKSAMSGFLYSYVSFVCFFFFCQLQNRVVYWIGQMHIQFFTRRKFNYNMQMLLKQILLYKLPSFQTHRKYKLRNLGSTLEKDMKLSCNALFLQILLQR